MMICEKCRRRFSIGGRDYWSAKSGICPICREKHNTKP